MSFHDSVKCNANKIREKFFNVSKPVITTNQTAKKYRIHVFTGDRKGAGTDANVYLVVGGQKGKKSCVVRPKSLFSNDHERGSTTTVEVKGKDFLVEPPFSNVQVWRDNFGNIPAFLGTLTHLLFGGPNKKGSAAWFLDRVEIEEVNEEHDKNTNKDADIFKNGTNCKPSESTVDSAVWHARSLSKKAPLKYTFPFQRWIDANKIYEVDLYDTVLPQLDCRQREREEELIRMRKEYCYVQNTEYGPSQAAFLPSDETFSEHYYWNFAKEKAKLLAKTTFIKWTKRKWKSIEEIKQTAVKSFGKVECLTKWDSDVWFGLQRVQGVNPFVLHLCKQIPPKLNVAEETVTGLLEGNTLENAMEGNRIFICDLEILEGIHNKRNCKMACPVALFYLKNNNDLVPIAIQLNQEKGPDNPVYTPKDSPNTWLVAKMFYNNAEAQHHQGMSHLGLTHLLMEGVCVCTHRNLSPSHPMFKLLAPHFLYLIAINTRGLEKLLCPGGWVDMCMTPGISGIFEVIKRGIQRYNFSSYGNIEEEIRSRGLLDPQVLPHYPYRDDAIPIYRVIRQYVEEIVLNYYDSEEKLKGDWEIYEWRKELCRDRKEGGVGLQGVPGDDEDGFNSTEELIDTVTIIISTCSIGHSAVNFQQYEQYGFVPNYPGILLLDPPTEKRDYTENDILQMLPDVETTLSSMVITKLLSSIGTNSLGDFEVQYMYCPKDVAAAEQLRKEVKKLSLENKKVNLERKHKFEWLDPAIIPNSISI